MFFFLIFKYLIITRLKNSFFFKNLEILNKQPKILLENISSSLLFAINKIIILN